VKDLIIRGGENVVSHFDKASCKTRCLKFFQDSVSVENALYADPRVREAAAVGVPDERFGELVTAVVHMNPAFQDKVSEMELISIAQERCVIFF
jgi:hypothetical protein